MTFYLFILAVLFSFINLLLGNHYHAIYDMLILISVYLAVIVNEISERK